MTDCDRRHKVGSSRTQERFGFRQGQNSCLPLFFPLALSVRSLPARSERRSKASGPSHPQPPGIPKQETTRVSVEELGLPSIRKNFGPNDERSIFSTCSPGSP